MATNYGPGYDPSTGGGGSTLPPNASQETGGNLASIESRLSGQLAVFFGTSTVVNKSGTITAGGVAQTLCAANANRRGLVVQNTSIADLWIDRKGASAVIGAPSVKIGPGNYWESPFGGAGTSAVSIIGATTGQAFTSEEY